MHERSHSRATVPSPEQDEPLPHTLAADHPVRVTCRVSSYDIVGHEDLKWPATVRPFVTTHRSYRGRDACSGRGRPNRGGRRCLTCIPGGSRNSSKKPCGRGSTAPAWRTSGASRPDDDCCAGGAPTEARAVSNTRW